MWVIILCINPEKLVEKYPHTKKLCQKNWSFGYFLTVVCIGQNRTIARRPHFGELRWDQAKNQKSILPGLSTNPQDTPLRKWTESEKASNVFSIKLAQKLKLNFRCKFSNPIFYQTTEVWNPSKNYWWNDTNYVKICCCKMQTLSSESTNNGGDTVQNIHP
jgi:hypothetical protein